MQGTLDCDNDTCHHNYDDDDDDVLQLPAEDEVLLQKLREESRAVFLQRKSRELLDNEELQVTHIHTYAHTNTH